MSFLDAREPLEILLSYSTGDKSLPKLCRRFGL